MNFKKVVLLTGPVAVGILAVLFQVAGILNHQTNYDKSVQAYYEKDIKTAVKYLWDAANEGHTKAQLEIGLLLLEGREWVVEQNPLMAAAYFDKAASKNEPMAIWHMGMMHMTGVFGKPSYDIAKSYFSRAAKLNYPDAYRSLAQMIANGWGTPQNLALAQQYANTADELERSKQKK
jgi:TPR repeat protein